MRETQLKARRTNLKTVSAVSASIRHFSGRLGRHHDRGRGHDPPDEDRRRRSIHMAFLEACGRPVSTGGDDGQRPQDDVGTEASCTDHGRYNVANVNADVEAGCECTTPHGMLSVFAPA